MESIEDIIGFIPKPPTREERQVNSKIEAEYQLKAFDDLPKQIRDFINYTTVPFPPAKARVIFQRTRNITTTIKEMKEIINDFRNS